MHAAVLLMVLTIFGTVGYHLIEGWPLHSCLYMTSITIATVGFLEVATLWTQGEIFTIFLIISGIGVGGYAIGTIAAFLTEGQLLHVLRGSRMAKEITQLENHVIVCGYGKTGREICKRLALAQEPFIVLDRDPDKMDDALEQGYLQAIGDASEDDILLKAGIKKAKALISAISNDAANVYLVVTARTLNEHLNIVARGTDEMSQKKLLRVGATTVVSPFEMGAHRMAAYIVRPRVVEFIESISMDSVYGLHIERLEIKETSSLAGKRLDESYIKRDTNGALVIGMQKSDEMQINPPGLYHA